MLKKLLKSIVSDINFIYSDKVIQEMNVEALEYFTDAINTKINCIKSYDYNLWANIQYTCASYPTTKKIINKYLKEMY